MQVQKKVTAKVDKAHNDLRNFPYNLNDIQMNTTSKN